VKKIIAVFVLVIFLHTVGNVWAAEYTVNENTTKVQIQKSKVIVEEKIKLTNVDSSASGILWKLIKSQSKLKILSVFSDNRWLIPYRATKEGDILIGDLNKKNTKEINLNIKYSYKTDKDNVFLDLSNKKEISKISLLTNNNVREVSCDNLSEKVVFKQNEWLFLPCKENVLIKTRENNNWQSKIATWWKKIWIKS